MELRRSKDDQFWGCTRYPECTKAIRVEAEFEFTSLEDEEDSEESFEHDLPEDSDNDDELAKAHDILTDPLLSEHETAKKLLAMLPEEAERVIPLVLGEQTPNGRPTVEAVLRKKRRAEQKKSPRKLMRKPKTRAPGKAKRSPRNPMHDVDVYTDDDRLPGPALSTVKVPEHGGQTTPTSMFKHHEIPFDLLNPIQSAVLEIVEKDCNVVVAASTSAGKTVAAEMVMADALKRGGKAIFLSPLRAVSQEKYDDWSSDDHAWSDMEVSIVTGDYSLTEQRKQELRRTDVIVMTSEMLDSKTRRMDNEGNDWLLRTLVLVVDEAHLLTMEGRGDALECGLMRFTRQNPHARIVLLSATMPNVEELGGWLTHLNGKTTRVIDSAWRPTKLTVHWPHYSARGGPGSYHYNEARKREEAINLLTRYDKDKWIVFVHSKKAGYELLSELRECQEEAEFHNADLNRDSRVRLEKRFKTGDLRIVIATSTLAYGINMPARRVLVLGIHRGLSEVDPIDVKQMVGRAGRVGYDPEGDAYVLLPETPGDPQKRVRLQARFESIGAIDSKLNDVDTLAFHLTAEVAEGDVDTEKAALAWHSRSFASWQGKVFEEANAGIVITKLAKAGILTTKEGTSPPVYEATMLGRVSSWLYYSPFDVSDWCGNFRKLIELDRLRDDDCLAWALGAVSTAYRGSYLPRELENELHDVEWRLRNKGIERLSLPATVLAIEGMITGTNYKPLGSLMRQLSYDSDRIIQAISLIDRYVIRALGRTYCDLVGLRLKYGCGWKEADLCRLPGVGAKKAHSLMEAGVNSIRDVIENKAAVVSAVGKRTAIGVLRAAKGLLKEEGSKEQE